MSKVIQLFPKTAPTSAVTKASEERSPVSLANMKTSQRLKWAMENLPDTQNERESVALAILKNYAAPMVRVTGEVS